VSIVSLRNTLDGHRTAILNAAAVSSSLGLTDMNRLTAALDGALAAVDALKAAQEKADQLMPDQNFSPQYRVDQADKLRTTAAATANSALADLRTVADGIYAKVSASWKLPRPSGVSDAMLLDRKADICRMLEQTEDAPHAVEAATELLSEALLAGDPDSLLTAYVIASGPLDLWFRGHGVTPAMTAADFARATGSTSVSAALQPLIGEAGALAVFVAAAKSEIDSTIAAMKRQADGFAVVFSGQGVYKPGSLDGQPASVDPGSTYLRSKIAGM
jgi:hypothetical protein